METKFCRDCGAEIATNAEICPKCGVRQISSTPSYVSSDLTGANSENGSSKSRLICFLLCTFLGAIGVHRFYVGKIGTGIAMILTLGLGGLWVLIDWIVILCGNFTDAEHKFIKKW